MHEFFKKGSDGIIDWLVRLFDIVWLKVRCMRTGRVYV